MSAPRAIQSYIRVSDVDLLESYAVLRRGVFKFLTRGRAFGNEGQLQGAHGAGCGYLFRVIIEAVEA
eukprot:4574848-Heterocapsa_arctica.AAC.1